MNSSGIGDQLEIPYFICGKRVCFQLWIKTPGISQSHFYNVQSLFLKGHKCIIQQVARTPLQKTSEAVAWMDSFFTYIGDRMPDRSTIHLLSHFHLPKQSFPLLCDYNTFDPSCAVSVNTKE